MYTHLTPLLSLKKAVKTPFKNLIVNWAQKDAYKKCGPILDVSSEIEDSVVEQCYSLLDESFEVGESLIITDSIDLGGSIEYTQDLSALLKASAKLSASGVTLRKTHLHRASKDVFHLYIDKGAKGSLNLSFSLNLGVQILSLSGARTPGLLKTEFYPWDLKKDSGIAGKSKFLAGIIRFLSSSKSDLIRAKANPYKLNHKFRVKQNDLSFLVWRQAWRTNNIRSSITHKDDKVGEFKKEFVSYSKGKRSGINYVQLLSNSIAEIFADVLDDDSINFDLGDDNDPANTPFGNSTTREVIYESEVTNLDNVEKLEKPIININYKWRGWKITKTKAQNIVNQINDKFDFPFFHKDVFNQTTNIQIYNIGVRLTLYDEFIYKMMNINPEILRKYFEKSFVGVGTGPRSQRPGGRALQKRKRIKRALKRIRTLNENWEQYSKSNEVDKAYQSITKMVSTLEGLIPFRELIKIVDSKKYFAIGSIQGFREGDENGDSSHFSHAMGSMGNRDQQGKIHFLRSQVGMIPNEFFGHWFIGKL